MRNPSPKDPLLVRVASGDADAVKACIDRYGPLVWSITRKMFRDERFAEDCVQEIFIELWKSAGRFDPERGSESTFIATIARRRLIDLRRRSQRAAGTEAIDEEFLGKPDERLEHVDICDEAELAARALDKLRPEQKNVLVLSVHEGLSHQQIADRLSLPLGTVKSHIRRGLERVTLLLNGRKVEEVVS